MTVADVFGCIFEVLSGLIGLVFFISGIRAAIDAVKGRRKRRQYRCG
jgi:hypothetical protein